MLNKNINKTDKRRMSCFFCRRGNALDTNVEKILFACEHVKSKPDFLENSNILQSYAKIYLSGKSIRTVTNLNLEFP